MNERSRICGILFGVLLCSSAGAQFATPTTRKLDITLSGPDCGALPKTIQVVFDGRDREPLPARQDPDEPCHYTAEKRSGDAFTIGRTVFSLRLGTARTDCRVTSEIADQQPPYSPVGTLTFVFEPGSAHDLNLVADPDAFRLSYIRNYRPDPGLTGSLNCREGATFEGTGNLRDVRFPREIVELTLGDNRILIDPVIQEELRKNASGVPLTPAVIGTAYQRQVATRLLRDAPPYASANAATIVAERLRKKGLKALSLRPE